MTYPSKAQNFDEEFDQFKKSHERGYNQFVEQIDKDFADFLRSNWQTFQVHSGRELEEKPKPEQFPQARDLVREPLEMEVNPEVPKILDLSEELVMPVNYKTVTLETEYQTSSFPFFGDNVQISYDQNLTVEIDEIDPDGIADFWEAMSQTDYRRTLDNLFFFKKKYGLNDFGYYLLIKEFGKSFLESENQVRLFTWFVLAKSKYKTKIGYNESEIYLLLPSRRKVYHTSYFTDDDIPFYVMDYTGSQVYAYNGNYPGAYKTMDFSIDKPLNLKEKLASKEVQITSDDKEYTFQFSYNQNAIDFCRVIPQIELGGYFNAQPTMAAQQSLIDNLLPIVNAMSEFEAVSFLLKLVQTGFGYKIDEDQFGAEKVFFPEEILHYPFSDCEDRSVFFAYLVNTLVGNEVIGLDYPAHVATAVHFEADIPGDFFIFDGKKFIVCDPTYVNAPVGMSMRDLSNYSAQVIRKENKTLSTPALINLKKDLKIQGEIGEPQVIEVKPGKVMAANYAHQIMVQGKSFYPKSNAVFMARFSDQGSLEWLENFDETETYLKGFSKDNVGNYAVLIGNETIESHQLKLISPDGKMLWNRKIEVIESSMEDSNVQVVVYNAQGEKLAGKTYNEASFFNGRNLAIKDNKLIVILDILK